MAPIATYVFIDLETTGMPREEGNRTKITELCMIAVKREHLLDTRPGATPRVHAKFTHCFNPRKMIMPDATEVTGLCNDLLEFVTPFDKAAFKAIDAFLNLQSKPICLLAHNGFNFDFPILKRHFENLNEHLPDDVMCADTYPGFYDLEHININKEETPKTNIPKTSSIEITDDEEDVPSVINNIENKEYSSTSKITLTMQELNNTTPKRPTRKTNSVHKKTNITPKDIKKVRRRFPWSAGESPKVSYKMKKVYERLLNRPGLEAHRAESDCIMTMECAVAVSKDFVKWVDDNHCKFSDVTPMTVGLRIDL